MDNDNSQAPSGGDELKKLEEELKGLGSTPQEVPVQTPATEQIASTTPPLTPTPSPVPEPTTSVKETTLPPEPPKSPNKILMIAVGFLVLALAGAGVYLLLKKQAAPKACTEDAKLCPDGSAVGRVGPNCEFAPCQTITPIVSPSPTDTSSPTPSGSASPTPTTTPSASPSASPSATPTSTP